MRRKQPNNYLRLGVFSLIILMFLNIYGDSKRNSNNNLVRPEFTSDFAYAVEAGGGIEPSSTPTPAKEEISEKEEIRQYIRQKFGEDADKAFLLLEGTGEGSCAENRNLDQNAVNDNTWWGGVGKDWGIFQINDAFHPVFKLNLHKDWKANVDYAYRMFVRDGRTFSKRWTCGKFYKSLGYKI